MSILGGMKTNGKAQTYVRVSQNYETFNAFKPLITQKAHEKILNALLKLILNFIFLAIYPVSTNL